MALDGESIKISTITLWSDPTDPRPDINDENERIGKCCFQLPVLAVNGASTDEYKNDKSSYYFGFNGAITGVVMELYKNDVMIDTLTNNDWGTYYAYGFHQYAGKSYGGYLLDWNTVIQHVDGGEGKYKIKATATAIGGATKEYFSKTFCLKEFTQARADRTVRIEWYHNRIIGNPADDTDRISFKGLNWYNALRLPDSFFGRPRFEYTEEEIQYEDGTYDETDYKHDVIYELICAKLSWAIHDCIRNDVLMSDRILITDYNLIHPMKPIPFRKQVKRANNYEPQWKQKDVYNVSVIVEFKQDINNLDRKPC